MTALVTQNNVLTSSCPYSEVPLYSECSGWFPVSLSLHQECPYIKCSYIKRLLYLLFMLACFQAFVNFTLRTVSCVDWLANIHWVLLDTCQEVSAHISWCAHAMYTAVQPCQCCLLFSSTPWSCVYTLAHYADICLSQKEVQLCNLHTHPLMNAACASLCVCHIMVRISVSKSMKTQSQMSKWMVICLCIAYISPVPLGETGVNHSCT